MKSTSYRGDSFYDNVDQTLKKRSKLFQQQVKAGLFRKFYRQVKEIDGGLEGTDLNYPEPRPFTVVPCIFSIDALLKVVNLRTTNSRCSIVIKMKRSKTKLFVVEHNYYWKFENAPRLMAEYFDSNPDKIKGFNEKLYIISNLYYDVQYLKDIRTGTQLVYRKAVTTAPLHSDIDSEVVYIDPVYNSHRRAIVKEE